MMMTGQQYVLYTYTQRVLYRVVACPVEIPLFFLIAITTTCNEYSTVLYSTTCVLYCGSIANTFSFAQCLVVLWYNLHTMVQ